MVMHVELQTTCSALGYQEGDVYHKEPDCLETVKDLIRFLKREDESCDIRQQLGEAQIVQNDLLPILTQYKDERLLWETVIRLLVNLTQPAVLCFQSHVPDDKPGCKHFLEVESHLQAYKEAFANEALFAVVTKKLGDLLQLDWENRQEEDRLLIERILILVRNVLHVPPNLAKEQRTDDDASIHDQVLWALHVSGLEDLLLYLASAEDERQFAFHVVEIITLMFREQTPEQLASAGTMRTLSERTKDERELDMIRERERAQKKANQMKYSTRHSNFGGTYVVSNMKSISERNLITHSTLSNTKTLSFDKNKQLKKKPKNRKPITESELTRRSTLSIRIFLKEFCIQFLENCYNPLMAAVKDTLVRSRAQENDETYYLWAMRFFMEFQRRHNFRVDLVGETMSVATFHYIQTNLVSFHEMLLTNKKEGVVWSRRMHLALRAYYELLQNLAMMDKSKEQHVRDSTKVIKSNVFYMMEYRDIFITLLRKFDETRQSRSFLRDLVEATHLFLKLLEKHCHGNSHLVVQKKKRNVRRKKKAPKRPTSTETALTQQDLEDLWDEISSDLSAVFQGRVDVPTGITPFDAVSEVDVDQQRADTMSRIQECMRGHQAAEAVAIFRAAREVWPENDQFGRADITPEDEFMALREVFHADLPRSQGARQQPEEGEEEEDDGHDEVEEEERAGAIEIEEQEFHFATFVGRFAHSTVVKAYTTMLANYRNNSTLTNHAIVKMLHRLSFDTGAVGMLFQASLFRVFLKILKDPASKTSHLQEIATFAKHIVRKFFNAAEKNDKIFVELFFWKNQKEGIEVTEGYGSTRQSVKGKVVWTEEQEQELKDLFERFQDREEPDMDVVDHMMGQFTDQTKSRRQIIQALVHLGVLSSAKDLKRKKGPTRPKGWREEEELELRTLFDEHKDSTDPVGSIIEAMATKRSKPIVIKKILELGLVEDRKQLRKKRSGKSGRTSSGRDEWAEGGVDDGLPTFSSSEDEDDTREPPPGGDSSSEPSSGESDSEEDEDAPMYIQQIKKALKKLTGHTAAIEWVKTCLTDVAQDREEDDDDEAIAMVPTSEDHENAMEDRAFQTLLKRVGVKPPADQQEKFWRVPGYLKPADLRSRAAALTITRDGEVTSQQKKPDSRKAALNALVKQKKASAKVKATTSEGPVGKGKRRSKFRREIHSDEENGPDLSLDEESSQPGTSQTSTATPGTNQSSPVRSGMNQSDGDGPSPNRKHTQKRQRHVIEEDSSSDSDDGDRLVIADEISSDSVPPPKRPRVADSSDSDDEPLVSKSVLKGRKPMEEDSSDDEPLVTRPRKVTLNVDSDSDNDTPSVRKPESFPATMFSAPADDSDSDIEDHIPLKRVVKRSGVIESDSDD